ncbi:GNAT family N-acetyltransferase [Streptomyces sp. NPDC015127]|uniref:GNAT family N-acetyltransferase n=1 Tax=Streptomyces sp. NPDC015127 TaxID=3364939 RepID=UPI0036FD357F
MTDDPVLRLAHAGDRPVLERLWQLFRHDLSEFVGPLPAPDGTFHDDRLDAAFDNPDRALYLLTSGEHPVGLVLVRGLREPRRVMSAFFVVRALRRTGVGTRAVQDVVGRHPGPWDIPFQDANAGAVRFWRGVAGRIAGAAWTEERRPVPGKPDVPPDVWISFDTTDM